MNFYVIFFLLLTFRRIFQEPLLEICIVYLVHCADGRYFPLTTLSHQPDEEEAKAARGRDSCSLESQELERDEGDEEDEEERKSVGGWASTLNSASVSPLLCTSILLVSYLYSVSILVSLLATSPTTSLWVGNAMHLRIRSGTVPNLVCIAVLSALLSFAGNTAKMNIQETY